MNEALLTSALQATTFFWGAAIGSFLNVVIYRLPRDLSLVHPGSRCSACETPIKWYDNIPCLSYFILGGKCRACKVGYSSRYALIEIMCGLLALALFRTVVMPIGHTDILVSLGTWIWWQVFVFALVVITFIDLEHFYSRRSQHICHRLGLFRRLPHPCEESECRIGWTRGWRWVHATCFGNRLAHLSSRSAGIG